MMARRRTGKCRALLSAALLTMTLVGCGMEERTLPQPTEAFFVNDYADLLSPEQEIQIAATGQALQKATSAQVVLATVQDTGGRTLENFSLELSRAWALGQENMDNGVLLLFTVDGPRSRIEVGYGLEGAIPDSKAGRLLDTYLVPHYNDPAAWGGGLTDTYTAIVNVVYAEYGLTENSLSPAEPVDEAAGSSGLVLLLPLLTMVGLLVLLSRHGGGRGGGGFYGGFGGPFVGGLRGGGFSGGRGGGGFGGGGANR